MKKIFNLLLSMLVGLTLEAHSGPAPDLVITLWPDGAPTDNGTRGPEEDYGDHFHNVQTPELWVYLPERPEGLAVMACPGGGYSDVWYRHEGTDMAEWYNRQGIVYAVLKYRLPNGHHEVPLDDAQQAMRILRSHAREWNIQRLGIQGCSAGGHLAAMASTHYVDADTRPDFQILFYPVITLDPSFTHDGTLYGLLGDKPTKRMIAEYSNEQQVTADTPPAFILASTDDGLVPVRNSEAYYDALRAHGVSATMHLYPEGGHGWCWRESFRWKANYCAELEAWLRGLKPRKRVLWIGDSITDGGWGNSGGTMKPSSERNHGDMNHIYGHSYMMLCAAQLQARHPGDGITCWNRGISGNTLAQMAERWQADALALRPNVISILVGTNDVQQYLDRRAKAQREGQEVGDFDVAGWQQQYLDLLRQTRDSLPGVTLMLGTPFVARAGRVGQSADYAEREALVGRLAEATRRVADEVGAVVVPFDTMFATLLRDQPASGPSYWIWDGIHPTPAGHWKMMETWMEAWGD